MTTNVTSLADFQKSRTRFSWRGRALRDMTREELEDALLEVDRMYQGALKQIGERRRVQLVPVEVVDQAPSVISAMLGASLCMLCAIALVAVLL